MSSILSVSSRVVEHAPQTLHLVAFGTGDRVHWVLFAPNRTAEHKENPSAEVASGYSTRRMDGWFEGGKDNAKGEVGGEDIELSH